MNNFERLRRTELAFFTIEDISRILDLTPDTAAVYLARASKRGDLLRIKRGIYIIASTEPSLDREDRFRLANFICAPSYISLQTALAYYEMSTQIIPSTIESISLARRNEYSGNILRWLFWQTSKKYYFGFLREKGFFIAEPEKAIIDVAQLITCNRYSTDISSINFDGFDWRNISRLVKIYPKRVCNLLDEWRNNYA